MAEDSDTTERANVADRELAEGETADDSDSTERLDVVEGEAADDADRFLVTDLEAALEAALCEVGWTDRPEGAAGRAPPTVRERVGAVDDGRLDAADEGGATKKDEDVLLMKLWLGLAKAFVECEVWVTSSDDIPEPCE